MVDSQTDIADAALQILEHAERALRDKPSEEMRERLEQIRRIASRISQLSDKPEGTKP